MRWIDPTDCLAARECLQQGHVLEAARRLLVSPHREHRAARQLLLEISTHLITQAAQALDGGEIRAAWEAITCAEQCAALPAEAVALKERLAQACDELERNQAWHDQRLREAEAWAKGGRVHSALRRLEPLTDVPEVQRLRADLEERLANFERYLRECRDYLAHQAWEAARECWERARAILPADPEVLRLARELRPVDPSNLAAPGEPGPARRLDRRAMTFAMGNHALVVLAPEVVIGNPLGEGVHVPLLGRVHRRHALLLRDRGRYRITPCAAGHAVAVNGQPATGPRELADGDLLELGGPLGAWSFRLPVAGSWTAILEPAQPSSTAVQTPDGSIFHRVILADESIHIRPRSPAHLRIPDLPCQSLRLHWSETGLVAVVQGGTLAVAGKESDGDESAAPVWLPGRLVIRGDLDEAERLGRAFLGGQEVADTLCLEFRDPFPTRDGSR